MEIVTSLVSSSANIFFRTYISYKIWKIKRWLFQKTSFPLFWKILIKKSTCFQYAIKTLYLKCIKCNITKRQPWNSMLFLKINEDPVGSMSYVIGLPNNSYKPITNRAWVRARLCKLQKRVHPTRNRKW